MPLPLPEKQLAVTTSIEDYATAYAYLVHLKDQERALELLSITPDDWRVAGVWLDRIAAEVSEGEQQLSRVYATALSTTRKRLRASADAESAAILAAERERVAIVEPSQQGSLGMLSDSAAKNPLQLPRESAGEAATPAQEPRAMPQKEPSESLGFAAEAPREQDPNVDSESTLELMKPVPHRPPLPFVHGTSSLEPTSVGTPRSSHPHGTTLGPQHAGAASALPFTQGPAPATHAVTLEQYVSLLTNLERFPGKAPMILERYGLAQADFDAVHASFRARFAKDAALYAEFGSKMVELRKRLEGH